MGCCQSTPTGPDEIIPDPGPTEGTTFAIKSCGMLSNDYIAFQGESTQDPQRKWMFINKTGSQGVGDCLVEVENFLRGTYPNKPNKGQVLWTAKFNQSPRFQQMMKPRGKYARLYKLPFEILAGYGALQTEEPDDSIYFRRAGMNFHDNDGTNAVNKWSVETTATLQPGVRGQELGAHQLYVFARGTAICHYSKVEDAEGKKHWKKDVVEFVDELCFSLTHAATGKVLANWWIPGDLAPEKDDLRQETPVFLLNLVGGWFKQKPIIKTAAGHDPILGLLIGYLCAYEYSPRKIKYNLESTFPDKPMKFGFGSLV